MMNDQFFGAWLLNISFLMSHIHFPGEKKKYLISDLWHRNLNLLATFHIA